MTNKLFLIFSIQFYASIFLVFIPFVILYKTSRLQTLVKFFVLLNRPDDKVIDKTSSYRKSQNENGNTSKFFVGFHRIKKFSSPKIKIWFEPMFFSGFFCGFERCGSAAFPNFRGGTSSPPQAAKCVRTNLRILLQKGKVKEFWFASLRSATN